jgi:hypothetical protein
MTGQRYLFGVNATEMVKDTLDPFVGASACGVLVEFFMLRLPHTWPDVNFVITALKLFGIYQIHPAHSKFYSIQCRHHNHDILSFGGHEGCDYLRIMHN